MTFIIILSIVLTIIDQLSKFIVIKALNVNHSIEVIKNFFYLTYTHNKGAAFSILTGKRIFLVIIAIIIIAAIIYYLKKNTPNNSLSKIAFSLVIGGSLGNLIDRILRGYVIDFIDVKIFGYDFPIFNLADTFITIGIFILILFSLRKEKGNDNR
ncbi:MAG: signal peptidase II [Bacilli bacterium]